MMDTQRLKELTGTTALDRPLITAAEFSAEDSKSARPLWSKPVPKFGMAALLLLPVVAIAGTFLTGGSRSEQVQSTALGNANQPPAKPPESVGKDGEPMQQEIARLKAKSALDGQAKLEKQLAKQPNNKSVKTVQKPSSKPTTAPSPQRQPTSATSVAIRSEPPKIATAPVSRPEVIPIRESRSIPRPQTVERGETTAPRPVAIPKDEPIVDPQERWQQLVKLGSYGSVRPESSAIPESIARSESPQTPEPQAKLTTWERQDTMVLPTIDPLPPEPQPTSLIAGTNAAAVFETPLVLDDSKSNDRFTIALSEAIPDATGKTALPANTKLTVQVEGVSQTGRVQLSATSATWNKEGQTKEMTLPTGAIQIRGDQGRPLMAQQFEDKGKELAALDRGQFILSAIRGASGQLIQSNTRVQTGGGSTIVTQENQRPNVLAGALQSGTDTLLTTIGERNKRAAEEIQQRPPIRYIAAGTPVQVFVNQSVQLPL
jgi:Bacterial conjugation TrbI-like protein